MIVAAVLAWAVAASTPLVLAVGANHPWDGSLAPLNYADDDAVAAAELFGDPSRTWLLTTLDKESQEVMPEWTSRAQAATRANLHQAVGAMVERIAQERREGQSPVVMVWLVGHGAYDRAGRPFLALEDAPLASDQLVREVIQPLSTAHRVHVFIDACHAEALVQWRAAVVNVGVEEVERQSFGGVFARIPNAGVVVAASGDEKTWEWKEIGSGVFSALVRAGLRGAANANADACVTYDELTAYVTSALQGIPLPAARPSVMSRPPGLEHQAPLSCREWFQQSATLTADLSALGPIRIEDSRGRWLSGGRFEPKHQTTLWLPQGLQLAARAGEAEWGLVPGEPQTLHFGERVEARRIQTRGAVERAVEQGLFSVPFGPGYHRGYVAAQAASYPSQSTPAPTRRLQWLPWLGVPGVAVSGALLATWVVTVALMTWNIYRYTVTDLERPASEARQQAVVFGSISVGTFLPGVVMGLTSAAWIAFWLIRGW